MAEYVLVLGLIALVVIAGVTFLQRQTSTGLCSVSGGLGSAPVQCGATDAVSFWGFAGFYSINPGGGSGLTLAQATQYFSEAVRTPLPTQFAVKALMIAPSSWSSAPSFTAVLSSDGTVWTAGANLQGELGWATSTTTYDAYTPGMVPTLSGIVDIAAGVEFGLAVRGSDGSVWAWGKNNVGQLGTGSTAANNHTPAQVVKADGSNLLGVVEVESKGSVSVARTASGQMWMWGGGVSGTGLGNRAIQVTIPGGLSVVSVMVESAGDSTQMSAGFITSDGHVYTWGSTLNGALGQGATPPTPNAPTALAGISNASRIWGSDGPTVIVEKSDKTFVGFGWDQTNEVCDGPAAALNAGSADKWSPVALPALTNVKTISMSGSHIIVLKVDGTVWGCGQNNQLQSSGDGSPFEGGTQVSFDNGIGLIQVPGLSQINAAAAGGLQSYASV